MNQTCIVLSAIKRGQLAAAGPPTAVMVFVRSDIVGDPVDLIASGPTWVSSTVMGTRQAAAEWIKKIILEC